MSFRLYAIVSAGLFTSVLSILLVLTPLRSSESDEWHSVHAHERGVSLDPVQRTVLPVSAIKPWFGLCSRPSPDGIVGAWHPTTTQIQAMEWDLSHYLEFLDTAAVYWMPRREHPPLERYHRQYIGLTLLLDRPTILINAFTVPEDGGGLDVDWRRRLHDVCDGGATVWSLEYDPATHRFRGFTFGGEG